MENKIKKVPNFNEKKIEKARLVQFGFHILKSIILLLYYGLVVASATAEQGVLDSIPGSD